MPSLSQEATLSSRVTPVRVPLACTAKSSTTPTKSTESTGGAIAHEPAPRLANASASVRKSALLVAAAASRIASRCSVKVASTGVIIMPATT